MTAATSQPRKKSGILRKLLWTFGILLGLFAAAIIWGAMLGSADDTARKYHDAMMTKYFQALSERRTREAYEAFTTEKYRATWTFAQYEAAQKQRQWKPASEIKRPGELSARPTTGGVRVKYYDLLRAPDADNPFVWYTILDTPQGPRIDATARVTYRNYRNTRSGAQSTEEVDTPEPW
jgi:hypothetical protein